VVTVTAVLKPGTRCSWQLTCRNVDLRIRPAQADFVGAGLARR